GVGSGRRQYRAKSSALPKGALSNIDAWEIGALYQAQVQFSALEVWAAPAQSVGFSPFRTTVFEPPTQLPM
ncbi:MAG TPA: hypothetical protein VMA31_01825, partial [Bryobacteraceae bacterium]|nr:hypothetical protein [Bryobacteraceae bacterium]